MLNMNEEITIKTSLGVLAIGSYIIIILSMFIVLIGAGIGAETKPVLTKYHEYVESIK